MKTKTLHILSITFLLVLKSFSQKSNVIDWINKNAIKIENTNPDTILTEFTTKKPKAFENAKIFGFGEASHHGKEFFNLKAKFFKHLVLNHDVKTFIIEDSYPSELGINEWISGGKGDLKTIANNFTIAPWYCKEVVNLLKWMRDYNYNKDKSQQIRFFGMDIQNVKNINHQILNFIKENNIPVNHELQQVVIQCTNKKIEYGKKTDWATKNIPKLNKIEHLLIEYKNTFYKKNPKEINLIIRALNYLKKYTFYIQNHYSQDRDLKMYENVKWIVENETTNGKAFIWAHNEHINYNGFNNFSYRNIYNLGKLLKEHYKDNYYSVGFDFGTGILPGISFNKKKTKGWKNYNLEKPYNKTYASTLFYANLDVYFVDINKAIKSETNQFFNKKNKQLVLGSSGYNPKKNQLYTKKYSEMYDALIFIKNITVPNYNL